jgi:exodeoxyribonuclease-3
MKPLKILSWNVNGLRARLRGNSLNWFLEEKPDILCLQELKATEDQIPEDFWNIPGYRSYFSSSKVLKGYNGVGIYSRLKPENVQESFGDGKLWRRRKDFKGRLWKFCAFQFVFSNRNQFKGSGA